MAEYNKVLFYRANNETHSVKLYDSADDLDGAIAVRDGSVTAYAAVGDLTDAAASHLRIRANNITQAVLKSIPVTFNDLPPLFGDETKQYGFKIMQNVENPYNRVIYTHDAVGMTPAKMNYDTGEFEYGDWESFCKEINRPVMLKYNGEVDYELDPNDQTKKLDGTPSDITNTSYGGNAMSEFRRLWLKLSMDSNNNIEVVFSNKKIDETYVAPAFTSNNGDIQEVMYHAMYDATYVDDKARSLATGSITGNKNGATEISLCKANGEGWYTGYKSQRDYIMFLLWLISKSTNSQAVFGEGTTSGGSGAVNNGTTKDKPQFIGYSSTTNAVKTFYIEHFWGNVWKRIAGWQTDDGSKSLVKMSGPYSDTGGSEGYINTGLSGINGQYIGKGSVSNEYGFLPIAGGGDVNKHYCDSHYLSSNRYALVGGNSAYGSQCGPAFSNLYISFSFSFWNIGVALSFLK